MHTASALDAYEALAPHYDLLTGSYRYDRWVGALDDLIAEQRPPGRRMLDLGCGTGHALEGFAGLGWQVTGCDLSPAMVARARARVPTARVEVADMRETLPGGPYDAVVCLDDTVNYLLSENELTACFGHVFRALVPGGVLVFDANLPLAYAGQFSRDRVLSDARRLLAWRGHGIDDASSIARATVEIFERDDALSGWERSSSEHVQRYWRLEELTHVLRAAGMHVRSTLGQRTGARIDPGADIAQHVKALLVAGRPTSSVSDREEAPMIVEI